MSPKSILFLTFLILFGFTTCENSDDKPVVNTPSGKIRGTTQISNGGSKFAAFEGIPYAKPPVGNRRFEAPELAEPWDHTLEATTLTKCSQTQMLNQTIVAGVEDCLYLNIYVPREHPSPDDKLDVIVRIHGGGFMYEDSNSYVRANYLMDKNVIFVTFNYRIGILGFLSTLDDVLPGNNGLKDQVLALTWVQKNIASFGGNPDSVTLMGFSAGSASTHLHYFSNKSKGLFHRGFSQSGCAVDHWVLQKRPIMKAKKLARLLGCPTNTSLVLVECLKQKPYEEIVSKTPLFFGYQMVPYDPFSPVIEKGPTAFLTDKPYEMLKRGEVHDLPWLASNTADEGLEPGAYFKDYLEEINEKWTNVAAALLHYEYTIPQSHWEEVGKKIKEYYIGAGKDINKNTFRQFIKILSDRHFLVDVGDAIKMQANVTQSPVYYYYFSYQGDYNPDGTVNHGDDETYLYGNFPPDPPELTPKDYKMLEVMTGMLASFAKTGKPTIEGVTWEPSDYETIKYLNISGFQPKDIKLETTDELAPNKFWRSIPFQTYEEVNAADNKV